MLQVDVENARHNMIVQQIRPCDVLDEDVLEVMEQMPREAFVPERYAQLAFADIEIPIGHGQSMMAPKVEGLMLQALAVCPGDRVLEVGTGSGYVTACLSWLSGEVISVDIHEDFTKAAAEKLAAQGIDHVKLVTADALAAPAAGGPFKVIAVTGALPVHTDHFEKQLEVGGRLFQVIGEGPAAEAQLVTRVREDAWRREALFETALAPLVNAPRAAEFVF
ncbi:MAG: protein-L-isoaspartate O-methyltransferase [Pseudomonadota bacterium]